VLLRKIDAGSASRLFLGDEADLVRPGVTTEVHDAKNVAVLQSLVSLEEEDLLGFPFELLDKLGDKLRLCYRSHIEEDGIVLTHGDGDGVFVVRMVRRKLGLRELDVDTFLEQGVITMKMMSNTSMTSARGVTLMLALTSFELNHPYPWLGSPSFLALLRRGAYAAVFLAM
jgi:hypothetical protein